MGSGLATLLQLLLLHLLGLQVKDGRQEELDQVKVTPVYISLRQETRQALYKQAN